MGNPFARFEKDKDEMLSKLKELGNTVLGKLVIQKFLPSQELLFR